jgi:hypothetical protein
VYTGIFVVTAMRISTAVTVKAWSVYTYLNGQRVCQLKHEMVLELSK